MAKRPARKPANWWWIGLLTCAVVGTGMAYTFWWEPVVHHASYWVYPLDLFGTVHASRWIEHGAFSYLYSVNSGVVTLPGFALLLTPFVKLSEVLHLLTTTAAFPLPKPSQWLLVGPVSMATSGVALGGLDALARSQGLSMRRRRLLLVGEAVAAWPVVVKWGHPEDLLALGLCAWALERSFEGRTVSAGWLLGGALTMQLYVVLVVPVFVGLLGVRRAAPLLARAAVLPGAILLALVIPSAHQTLHVLVDQPTPPKVNHPTPWVLVAPSLGHGQVAGGPGRLVGLAGACALGFLVARWRADRLVVVWIAGAALTLRCLTEAVMTPYYVVPAIALVLVAVASQPWRRWLPAACAAAVLTVLTYYRPGIWWYWLEMAGTFAVMLLAAWPRRHAPLPAGAPATASAHHLHPQAVDVPLGVIGQPGDRA